MFCPYTVSQRLCSKHTLECKRISSSIRCPSYKAAFHLPRNSVKDQLTLMLIKLKLNVSYAILGGFFNVKPATASKHFGTTLNACYETFKPYLQWLDRARIKARMSTPFKALFPSCRAVIDASEVFIQQDTEDEDFVLLSVQGPSHNQVSRCHQSSW